jgi:hypothetical protein
VYDWPWHIAADTEAVLFGLTVKVSVITESQPVADGTVRVYVPAVVKACPPKVYDSPWHIAADTEAVLFEFTVKVSVITESHPLADGTVRVYVPAVVKACPPKGYDSPWHIAADTEAVLFGRTVKISVITESQPLADRTVRV